MTPRFSQLHDWLTWLETLHFQSIDLGLSRIYNVASRLQLLYAGNYSQSGKLAIADSEVFIVAGTNGKGSCVKTMEQSLLLQGYQTGTYTSPHIHHYCERININGQPVAESLVCDAFAAIDATRGDISLTYFEFGTLAALWIFVQQQIPKVILEVGLGGRLDAVNIVDADIAVITSIALDHEEWLGNDVEQIAVEKLGVARPNSPVVIAEPEPLKALIDFAQSHSETTLVNRDFWYSTSSWQSHEEATKMSFFDCALPVSSVAAALQTLRIQGYPMNQAHIDELLPLSQLEGRFQQVQAIDKQWVFDVAHNIAAVTLLAERLEATSVDGGVNVAVFAAMDDKDVQQMVNILKNHVDQWFIGDLTDNPRAAKAASISAILKRQGLRYQCKDSLKMACRAAVEQTTEHDRIVVFGSFFTVAAIQEFICGEKIGTA